MPRRGDGWDDPLDQQDPLGGSGAGGGMSPLQQQIAGFFRQASNNRYEPTLADVSQWGGNVDPRYLQAIQAHILNTWGPQWLSANPVTPPSTPPPPPGPPPGPQALSNTDATAGVFRPPAPHGILGGWGGGGPTFQPPTWRTPPAFQEPDYQAALQDPGYQAEARFGRQQMEASAAARGVLNGGGTLADLNAWGQNFATQRVRDVRERALGDYMTNYQTQYVDPYKYAYQSALDQFTGGLNTWMTRGQVGQRQNEIGWNQSYIPFNDLWNRRVQVAGM